MKRLLSVLVVVCCTSLVMAQDAYFDMYKAKDWDKLEKKIVPALQKQPKNIVVNYVAGLMYAHEEYPKVDYDKSYNCLVTSKLELARLSAEERNKYSKYVTQKKIQTALDTTCNRLYDKTIHSNSIGTCNAFLNNYKKAKQDLIDGVIAYRNTLAFVEAQKQNTAEAYQSYVVNYPNAAEVSVAMKRRDKLAYEDVLKKNTCEAFMAYIKNYPNSEYTPQVQQLYVDKIFSEKTGGGTYSEYEQFVKANPKNKMAVPAIRKMMELAKSQNDMALMMKTVEYSRDIDFEHTLYEFYKEFTRDGESLTLYYFCDLYPRTFLDTLVAKDVKIAAKGDALELIEPYDSAKSYRLFTEYIKMAAPKDKAFVVLQKLISADVAAKNWKKALKTVNTYKPYFGNNNKEINNLIQILSATDDKTVTLQEFPSTINTKEGGEYSPIITADNKYLYFCGKNRSTVK